MEIWFAVRTVYIYIYMFFIYNLHLITRTIAIHIYHSKCAYKSIMLQISKISRISILSNFPRFHSKHFNHCKQTFRTFQTNQTKQTFHFRHLRHLRYFRHFQTLFHTFQALQTSQPGLSKPPTKKMAGTKTKSLQNFFTINPQSHTSLVVPIYYSNAPRNVAYLHRDQCHYWLHTPIPPWLNGPRSMVTNAARHPWN